MLEAFVKTAALLILCANTLVCSAAAMTGEQVTAEVSGIAHLRAGEYSVEITVANGSSAPINMTERPFRFFVQSDVLGRWIELSWRRETGANSGPSPVRPGEVRKNSVIVTLPARLPHLYRNNEDDVNMRFQYSFACSNGTAAAGQTCTGESAYWVTPGTDRWVLREGM